MPARNLPKPVPGPITSRYGPRTLPDGRASFHNGQDYAWLLRDPDGSRRVLAPLDTVAFAGVNSRAGNFVSLPLGDGYSTRLAHLASVAVRPGQGVRRGDLLGIMGETGTDAGFGVHLHVDVFAPDGSRENPADYYSDTFVGSLAPASGDVEPFPYESETDMRLIRTPDGTVALVTAAGVKPITSAAHLAILQRVLKADPGEYVNLTAAEAAVVRGYFTPSASTASTASAGAIADELARRLAN